MAEWKKVKIKDIESEDIQNGYSPLCVDYETKRKSLSLGALTGFSLDASQQKNISENAVMPIHSLLKRNDILVSRSNTKDKVGRAAVVLDDLKEIYYPDLMMRFQVNEKIADSQFVALCLQSPSGRGYFESHAAGTSTSMVKINKGVLENFSMPLPPIEEQKKIATTLSVWDSAIEKMEKLIEAKENSYTCFLASSIKTNAYVELGIFLTEVSERNKYEKIQQVLSVSNSRGFILPEEQFDRKVASENLSNYKIVRLGQYAYNPSRINVGSIARLNDWKEAVISPMYTVFEIDNQKQLDSDFLLHWLNSSEAKQRIKNSAQGSVRETVGFGDLCKIKIPKFDLKKQQKIVSVLNSMNQEITLLMQQLENYKKQKQGLMQKLLTGQWRVK